MFTIGDPTTAKRLQVLQQALQGAQTPGAAASVQEQMQGAQQAGAGNILTQAMGQPNRGMDPLLGYNPVPGDQKWAQANYNSMRADYAPQVAAIAQAMNRPNPMTSLGVPGMFPRAGAQQAVSPLQQALLGLPSTSGLQQSSMVGSNQ